MRRLKSLLTITLAIGSVVVFVHLLSSIAYALDPPQLRRVTYRFGELRFEPPTPVEPRISVPALDNTPTPHVDPYDGFAKWCEPLHPTACTRDEECSRGRDGRARRCIKPWWTAPGEKLKVCAGSWPTRHEQKWRKARLAAIVEHICGRGCDESDLTAFLGIVAERESSWRPWKSHRLNGDVKANRETWSSKRSLYTENPHYAQRDRWQGYGLFGQNSPLFVYLWDPQAPPEVLCREVEAVSTYLERARTSARKQADLGIDPTWATVHAAVAGGKIRPSERSIEAFARVAARAGLDGNARVTPRSFGRGFGDDVRLRRIGADVLRTSLDARFGAVFRARSNDPEG